MLTLRHGDEKVVNLDVITHPDVVFAYSPNYVDTTIKVANPTGETCWAEADVYVPSKLSLSPDSMLRKGRVRVGVVEKDEKREKGVRIYANPYTNPQVYRCKVVLYVYSKDGVIASRLEKHVDVRCEVKKDATI